MKISYIYLLFVIFIISGEIGATLSQTISSGMKNLSEGADLIVTGKVTNQNSEWDAHKTKISTKVTIQIDEYIKGSHAGNELVVVHQGGEVGDTGEYYSHIPTFKNDEEVLLFVKKRSSGNSYNVYEGESGKVTLIRDEATGEKITSRHVKLTELKKEITGYLNQQ